jgi:hypothetical protein
LLYTVFRIRLPDIAAKTPGCGDVPTATEKWSLLQKKICETNPRIRPGAIENAVSRNKTNPNEPAAPCGTPALGCGGGDQYRDSNGAVKHIAAPGATPSRSVGVRGSSKLPRADARVIDTLPGSSIPRRLAALVRVGRADPFVPIAKNRLDNACLALGGKQCPQRANT